MSALPAPFGLTRSGCACCRGASAPSVRVCLSERQACLVCGAPCEFSRRVFRLRDAQGTCARDLPWRPHFEQCRVPPGAENVVPTRCRRLHVAGSVAFLSPLLEPVVPCTRVLSAAPTSPTPLPHAIDIQIVLTEMFVGSCFLRRPLALTQGAHKLWAL